MTRTAHCSCGSLRAACEGEPASVVACSCTECQRRTGSVLGVGAYYPEAQVRISGDSRQFVRKADSGQDFTTHFCPRCGTSLYWTTARNPGTLGIAVGCFADPAFPAPSRSVFDQSLHGWVTFPDGTPGFVRGRDSAPTRS